MTLARCIGYLARRIAGVLAVAAALLVGMRGNAQGLHVYGPGGPKEPLDECAVVFSQRTHIPVTVTAGPEQEWIAQAGTDADLVYGGAAYMLTQFGLDHPGFLKPGSRVELFDRPIGILVRKGNPRGIHRIVDLGRPGVRILDVSGAGQVGAWEDLAGREHLIPQVEANIAVSVSNTAEALKVWQTTPNLDAWITFASWQKRMPDSSMLVRLPAGERIYRGTPIALAARSEHKVEARQFIDFLRSPEAHAIFRRWGWR